MRDGASARAEPGPVGWEPLARELVRGSGLVEPDQEPLTFEEEGHRYEWHGRQVPSVTGVLGAAGHGPDLEAAPRDAVERKARIGTAVHEAVAMLLRGRPPAAMQAMRGLADEEERGLAWGYLDAAHSYLRMMRPTVVAVELRMYSPELGVAGTLDTVQLTRGERLVVDWKCTASISEGSVGAQTKGYEMLWGHAGYAQEHGTITGRRVVQLRPDGTFRLRQLTDPMDEGRWLEAATEYGDADADADAAPAAESRARDEERTLERGEDIE